MGNLLTSVFILLTNHFSCRIRSIASFDVRKLIPEPLKICYPSKNEELIKIIGIYAKI